jgi:hypothetical protein
VVRALDERGDPIPDYHLQLVTRDENPLRETAAFETEVHAYQTDPSFRCFHLDLRRLRRIDRGRLRVRVLASSGSTLVTYTGFGSEKLTAAGAQADGKWDAQLDMGRVLGDERVKLFYPLTTTMLELRLDREPLPLGPRTLPAIFRFVDLDALPPPPPPPPVDPDRIQAP